MSAKLSKRAKERGKKEREKVRYRKTENLVERMIEIDTKRKREKSILSETPEKLYKRKRKKKR